MDKNAHNFIKCICEQDAACLCFECMLYYCDDCFKYIHDKTLNKNHKKEKLDYFVPIELKCHEYPKNNLNLFCTDERGKNNYI